MIFPNNYFSTEAEFKSQAEVSMEELAEKHPNGHEHVNRIFYCKACGGYHYFNYYGAKYGFICNLSLAGTDGINIQDRPDFDEKDFC